MVMAEYFTHDKLQELWQQIHHLHLTYLDTEDSPQKIQQRIKLEACIKDYLCIAPHNRKFSCPETIEVLHRSASSKKDFSGYRAVLAWNAISMYAGNLLSQPWRKEYRQIKTYCGFYKHQIEANLVGAESMFEAMGYKHAGDGILVLEGPVCPDRVTNVSQDSIVAYVECQILKTIWEEVSNNFKISWLDVLEFRESHLCSPELSIRMLNYRFHERRYQEQHPRSYTTEATETYSPMLRYSLPTVTHAPPLTGMHSFPPHSHLPHYGPPVHPSPVQCPSQCLYAATPYFANYSTYTPAPATQSPYPRYGTMPFHSVPVPCSTKQPCNGYCYPNGCVPPPSYLCTVPTAQLIELDHPQNGSSYDVPDSATRRQQDQLESHKQLAKSTNLDSLTLSKSKEDGAGTFESWDYVYRNLESQGYYKDLGERPDVLQPSKKSSRDLKKIRPSIELDDQISNLNINATSASTSDSQNLKVAEPVKKSRETETNRKKISDSIRVSQSSSYDNILSQQQPTTMKSISNGISKSAKTLPRSSVVQSPEKPSHVATLDTKKLRKQDVDKTKGKETKSKEESGGWNCNTCTFLNKSSVEICAMCGKSKKILEHVMTVGGPQCPRCTLVNQRDASVCQACDKSLLNSPTYI